MTISWTDKYRVLTELGSGGMARVYLAVSQGWAGFNKLVVLKVLRQDLADDAEFHAGFLREARVSARMSHPNVVAVNEITERNGIPLMVMEYLQGQPLSAILRRMHRDMPLGAMLQILTDSLRGLHYAHELADFDGTPLRLVHRDFTPQNIFVTYDGTVKVLDFGIAQVTRSERHSNSGGIKGKLRYMSPEQIAGAPLDRRADIFAAGVMLCEIAGGCRFWGDQTDGGIYKRMKSRDIPKPRELAPNCPAELEQICTKALAFEPENRYQTVAELLLPLEGFLSTNSLGMTGQALGNQLAGWFQEERQLEQNIIEASLAYDRYVSWSSICALSPDTCNSKTPPALATQTVPQPPRTLVELPTQLSQPMPVQPGMSSRRIARAARALTISLLLGAGVLLLRRPVAIEQAPIQDAAAATLSPQPFRFKLSTLPANASASLDGSPIAQGMLSKDPGDDSWHLLRVWAEGYNTVERRLQLNRDVELLVSLDRQAVPAPPISPNDTTIPVKKTPRTPLSINRKQPHPTQPLDSCSPPYTIDGRGLKQFKPECL